MITHGRLAGLVLLLSVGMSLALAAVAFVTGSYWALWLSIGGGIAVGLGVLAGHGVAVGVGLVLFAGAGALSAAGRSPLLAAVVFVVVAALVMAQLVATSLTFFHYREANVRRDVVVGLTGAYGAATGLGVGVAVVMTALAGLVDWPRLVLPAALIGLGALCVIAAVTSRRARHEATVLD